MSLTIIQKPLYKLIPANSPIIYTVSDVTSIATKFKVKYIADIHVHTAQSPTLTVINRVNTVKVSPNANGVGILDIKSILSSQVDTQRMGSVSGAGSEFKNFSDPHAIHLIDEFARGEDSTRWYTIVFKVEYSDTNGGIVYDSGQSLADDSRAIFNGYLKNTDIIQQIGLDYGYDLDSNGYIMNNNTAKFLSNMPSQLYARLTDFGTASFFGMLDSSDYVFETGTNGSDGTVASIRFDFKTDTASISSLYRDINYSSGYQTNYSTDCRVVTCIAGIYPANLKVNSTFNNALSDGMTNYDVMAVDSTGAIISQIYNIKFINNDCKGFEGIRLAWLNQFGGFDYYTFNKKSIRTLKVKRQNYTQHSGTWNGLSFDMNNAIGGNRSYNTSSKEEITINTDYITEEEGISFEELLISPEVYLINEYEADDSNGLTNKYVEPVMLVNNEIVRKTKANDKLIQHSFTIEKSKNTNTQNI
tara:strand:- start:1220 stop:2638 length:1419 start_codon:yes stop_codon:yes gene_type:complete